MRDSAITTQRTQDEIMCNWSLDERPVASICCITFNHQAYLNEAIDSFLMQETNFPFEIIIHDDASTDQTCNIINDYAIKYPKIIKVIMQSENQYSKCSLINQLFVFPEAEGKYIAQCEGDDYWTDSSKLQKQVDFLEKNPDYVITYTDCQPFNEFGNITINFTGAKIDLDSTELKKATPIFTPTVCFRNILKEIPPDLMSARFGDLITWSQLGHFGKGKYMSNITPAAYRVHNGGIFSKKTIKEKYEMAIITHTALFAYYERINDKEISSFYKKEILKDALISLGIINASTAVIIFIYNFAVKKIKSLNRFNR